MWAYPLVLRVVLSRSTPRLMCLGVTPHNGASIGGGGGGREKGGGGAKGDPWTTLGRGGGLVVARAMHNTLKVFALCLVRVSCSRPQFWAGRKFT